MLAKIALQYMERENYATYNFRFVGMFLIRSKKKELHVVATQKIKLKDLTKVLQPIKT